MRKLLNKNIYLLLLAAWLVTIAVIIDNYWSSNASLKTIQNKLTSYVQQQEKDFRHLVSDTAVISEIEAGNYSEKFLDELVAKKYFIFFYKKDSTGQSHLHFWNTHLVDPGAALEFMEDSSGFGQLSNGYYVWNSFDAGSMRALALIPVKWNFIVTNEYLKNTFAEGSISANYNLTLKKNTAKPVRSLYGNDLFYVEQSGLEKENKNNPFSALLLIAATLIVLFIFHLAASSITTSYGFWPGLFFFLALSIGLRSLSYFMHIPLDFRQYELFDPAVYGSSVIFPSLGDLLINVVMFVWLVFFVRVHLQEQKVRLHIYQPFMKWVFLGLGSCALLGATFVGSGLVRSLVIDSNISFDVINFFSLNLYSVIGFVALSCIAIGYYFFCQNIIFLLKSLFPGRQLPLFLFVAIGGLIILSFKVVLANGLDEIYIYVLLWLLVFLFLINNTILSLLASRIISSKLIFWLFFFSLSIAGVIIRENEKKEGLLRKHYCEILASKSDPSNETLLNSMLTNFRSGIIGPRFSRFYDSIQNKIIKDSLLNENAISFKDKYETRVLTFTPDQKPLFNSDSAQFNELNTILLTEAKKTDKPGLYYFDESFDKYSYISKIDIAGPDSINLGYLFIIASPKRFKSDAIFPELFSRGRTSAIENSSMYSIGIYKDGKLVSSHNDYPFVTRLPENKKTPPEFYYEIDLARHYSLLWHYAGAGRVVVFARENRQVLESITLFSYLFCTFLLLTALFWFINGLVRAVAGTQKLKVMWQLNIRNQIHLTILLVSFISFVFIGIATILFFISRYQNSNREMLANTVHIMEREIKSVINNANQTPDSLFPFHEQQQELASAVTNISEVHGNDLNIYKTEGMLQVSSLSLPYEQGIIGQMIDPKAYYHLKMRKEVQFFQEEKIGRLKYSSIYIPVIDESGNTTSFLNIPYFTAQSRLNQEISNFLVTIINLNAFIFLIAGILAFFIANRITRSFSLIAGKMKKVSLDGKNEAIQWSRKDEVGALVEEYNKMVAKLEQSALALAKTEREGAWKEMARQVAHEIKNPLTPMKLSMQYLQRAIENNEPNIKQLTSDVSNTLIEQIDHLNQIANEFNLFANIDNARKEVFDLNEVLKNILNLYRSNIQIHLHSSLISGAMMIEADKTHINRLFTNLIQNAIQAVPQDRIPEITLSQKLRDGKVWMGITDNGEGIDEQVRPLMFTPNFTTKTSGSGLGLAMCKRIVEQVGGDIWFETKIGKGSTFYIQLPLVS